jgi:hypothetical protein
MSFAMGALIGASFGCSFGYVLSAIMWTGKQADIMNEKFRSVRLAQIEFEPELPLATRKFAA